MNKDQIKEKLIKVPSYNKKGTEFLASLWKCDELDIHQARYEIKNNIGMDSGRKISGQGVDKMSIYDRESENSKKYISQKKDINKDEELITVVSNKPLSPTEINEMAQVNGVTSYVTNYWVKSQTSGVWTYSIQVRKIENIDCISSFEKAIKEFKLPELKFKKQSFSGDFLVISLSDLHFDKRSYLGEKEDILQEAQLTVDFLLEQASKTSSFKDVYLILGNDFFNHDTYYNTTTKGTPQDSEGSYEDNFFDALTFTQNVINTILVLGYNIKVYSPKGNHDSTKSQYLQAAIKKLYENTEAAEIELSSKDRQYFRRGEVLVMLTHGDNIKPNKMPMVFSTEQAQNWDAKFKVIITGHTHKKGELSFISTDENFGVDIKVCPSLSKTDKWHYENGYVGNKRRSLAILYSDIFGELAQFNSLSL